MQNGDTPLHRAVAFGSVDSVALFLEDPRIDVNESTVRQVQLFSTLSFLILRLFRRPFHAINGENGGILRWRKVLFM